MSEKIKSCPFCGNEEISIEDVGHPVYDVAAECSRCGALGPKFQSEENLKNSDVFEAWNKRYESHGFGKDRHEWALEILKLAVELQMKILNQIYNIDKYGK